MAKPSPLSKSTDPSDPSYKWWETNGPTKRVYTEVLVEKLTNSPRKSSFRGPNCSEIPKRVTIMPVHIDKDEDTFTRPLSRSRSFKRPSPPGPIRETTIHLSNAGLLSARAIPDGCEETKIVKEEKGEEENRFKVVIKKIEDVIMKEKTSHDKMADAAQSAELIILIKALAKEMELLYGKVNEFSDSLNKLKKDFGMKEDERIMKPEPIKPKSTEAFRIISPNQDLSTKDKEKKQQNSSSPRSMMNSSNASPKTMSNPSSPFQRSNSSLVKERQTERKETRSPTQRTSTSVCPYVSPYRQKYGNLTVEKSAKTSPGYEGKRNEPAKNDYKEGDIGGCSEVTNTSIKDTKCKVDEENDKKPYVPGMSLVLSGWNRIQTTSYSRPSPLASPSCSERESDGEMTEEEIQSILKSATSKYLDSPSGYMSYQHDSDRIRKKT